MLEPDIRDSGDLVRFDGDIDLEAQAEVTALLATWLTPETLARTCVSILVGGAVNRSFLVEHSGEKYVLRVAPPAEHARRIAIDMTNSAVVAQIAGEAGVGPRVFGVKQPEGHSLIEFLPGVLNVETLRAPRRLHDVGLAVRALHELPIDGVRIVSTFAEIEELLLSAGEQGVPRPPKDFTIMRPKLEQARVAMEGVEGRCVSHRDLNPQNCIHDGEQVRLIDWDFSGVDTPYLDLAMLSTYADLTQAEAREFMAAAIGKVLPEDEARWKLMSFVHGLREFAWTRAARGLLVGRTRTDDALLPTAAEAAEDFYVAYGQVNLRFARRFADDPRFDEWLNLAASPLPAPGFR